MRALVCGAGAVGARAARQLHAGGVDQLTVTDPSHDRARLVADSLGHPTVAEPWSTALVDECDVIVLASPGRQREVAETALERGCHVVSTAAGVDDVRALLLLDAEARERHLTVAVGAGFSPGLTCVLARHAAALFDSVDEVHVAKAGTGGPACARSHHRSLGGDAVDWRDGSWQSRPGGSGRELCWFPDPIGGQDCYRAALPDALVLVGAFPGIRRVTARVAASRRDRLTAHLPMLRRPHPEGLLGAVRVEVRGHRGSARVTQVLGALDRPAVAAGAVAAVAATFAVEGRFQRAGAAGLAELLAEPVGFLHELARRGVRAATFDGSPAPTGFPQVRPPG